ncbi:MAG: hypothetical protein ACFFBD_02320 [Candidatus Hodarchaeota archaeon]
MDFFEILVWIVLIAVLMILDYALTVLGYRWYQKSFSQFISHENYELNPIWQKSIQEGREKRLFNIKHLFLVAMMSFLLLCLWTLVLITENQPITVNIFELCLGMLFFLPLSINLQHIANIVIFRFVHKNRDKNLLTGQVRLSYGYSLMQSILSRLQILVLLLFCFLLTNSIFILGGVLGEFVVFIQFTLILKKSRR